MSKTDTLNLHYTDMMKKTVQGMPDEIAEMYFSSLLDMACLMVQFGDITTDIVGDNQFKITAHAKAGVRNLTVNLEVNH